MLYRYPFSTSKDPLHHPGRSRSGEIELRHGRSGRTPQVSLPSGHARAARTLTHSGAQHSMFSRPRRSSVGSWRPSYSWTRSTLAARRPLPASPPLLTYSLGWECAALAHGASAHLGTPRHTLARVRVRVATTAARSAGHSFLPWRHLLSPLPRRGPNRNSMPMASGLPSLRLFP